jgi:hypothetical protein
MDPTEESDLALLVCLGLRVQEFEKDLKGVFERHEEGTERQDQGTVLVIVTRPGGDELHYPDVLPESDMSRLRK